MTLRSWCVPVLLLAFASDARAATTAATVQVQNDDPQIVTLSPSSDHSLRTSNAMAEGDTTYLWVQHGFDEVTDGSCQTRGWTGEERAGLIFAHVDNKHLINDAFITMGTKSLWFGIDAVSHPAEIAHWYYAEGFGSNWSQRLTSPAFTNGNYRLEFDGRIGTLAAGFTTGTVISGFQVQARNLAGGWSNLAARWVQPSGVASTTGSPVRGFTSFKCTVATHPDSQPGLFFASPLELRIVFNSPGGSGACNENGLVVPVAGPGAMVDNLRLDDLNSAIDPIPLVDFESGGTGVWALSAYNGCNWSTINHSLRDGVPLPASDISVKANVDPQVPSCAWSTAGPGGSSEPGAWVRITSPWIARPGGADSTFEVITHCMLPLFSDCRLLRLIVRGKNAGDTRAQRYFGTPGFLYVSNLGASDLENAVFAANWKRSNLSGSGSSLCDSLQLVLEVEDMYERFSCPAVGRFPVHSPLFNDVLIVQYHADADSDGVHNAQDLCPGVCAAGQDANGDGCPDATATMRHVESWPASASPIHYRLSTHCVPHITDGSDIQALRDAFAAWTGISGANLQLVEDPVTAQTNASAADGINLVTFEDDYAFPGNVLAIAPTLSYTRRTWFNDRIRLPGEIVDGDIIFNPNASFRTATAGPTSGSFDVRSVATHEIGHLFGLSHSPVADATMFPVLQAGTLAASLESDDRSAIAAAYPGATLLSGFGRINGRLIRGGNLTAIPGAIVLGILLDGGGAPQDTVASDYTDENGDYHLYRLPAGNYAVRVLPLDGSTAGLVPGAINARVQATAQTNFSIEWYGGPESDHDDPDVRATIAVTAGWSVGGIDIVSNIDVTPPTVVSASPGVSATDVRIDSPILVSFSEPVDANTIGSAFKLHTVGGSGTLGGHGQLLTPGISFVFVPDNPLGFSTSYELQITTALKDVQGNSIASTFTSTFTTQAQPPVSIANLTPSQAPHGALVTITGTGYDATQLNKVRFSTNAGFGSEQLGTLVTPTSIVVEVPVDAVSGPVKSEVNGQESNLFSFTLLTSGLEAPSPNGSPIAVGFTPSDAALAPDGKTAFAAGDGGFVRINLDPLRPFLREAKPALPAIEFCAHMALLPSGQRAYVTRPDAGDVVEVDADPNSGTFGQQLAAIPLAGRPDGIAISPNGQRVYVTDQLGGVVTEIDVDAGRPTYRHPLREIAVIGAELSGGIAIDARRDRLVLATRNLGVVAVDLDTTTIVIPVSAAPGAAAVAVNPGGTRVIATSPDAAAGTLEVGDPLGNAVPEAVTVGGEGRDLAIHPDGATAFVANSVLGRLQVLDITQPVPVQVANVATGSTPVAVAISAGGTLVATANAAAQTITLFNVVGTATPVRVTPPVASPGDRVAIAATGGTLSGATQVDVGTGATAVQHAVASAVGVAVPAGAQRSTSVTLVNGGVRSLAVPLQIVDRIDTLDPRATGITIDPPNVNCPGPVDGALEHVVVSPDGALLAVSREGPTCAVVDVYQVEPSATNRFGVRIVGPASFPGASDIRDLAFTPDSRRLWVATEVAGLFELNVEVGSPGLGTVLAFGSGTIVSARSLASDPMGRCVLVGADIAGSTHQVQLWTPGRTLSASVTLPAQVHSLSVTPDGHYALAGIETRASVIDLSGPSLVTHTPIHTFLPPDAVTSIAVSTDGRRAAGLFPGNGVAIWNLDPLAGTVGDELYFDRSPLGGTLSQLVAAPDGHRLFAGCADCASLYSFDPASPPGGGSGPLPGLATYSIGQAARALTRSADGRTLWVSNWNDGTLTGAVSALTLTRGATLAVTSGQGQSVSPSQTLPLPVRVHLVTATDGRDAAGALVRFSLADASQGALDGNALEVIKPTDITGEAEVTWTMPAAAAPVQLSIAAEGVSGASVTVAAEAVADPAVAEPVVVAVGPADGATGINANTPVFIRFSQRMVEGSVDSGSVFVTGVGNVGHTVQFEDDDRTVILRPLIPFAYGTTVTLELSELVLRDQEGQFLPSHYTTSFTVETPPVLAVGSMSPPSAPTGATITLNGQGFSDVPTANTVSFNGLISPVKSASNVSLVTTVPASASTGPLRITVGATTSAPVTFTVLPANPQPLVISDESDVRDGIEAIAITPDASRAYVTFPDGNSVLAFSIAQKTVIRSIPVGLRPQAIAITPDGRYAYVANAGSDNVTVIDVDPDSPTYHQTLGGQEHPIRVGDRPVSLAISPSGPSVLVVNAGDSTISIIDAEPDRGTFDRVIKTIDGGSGIKVIVIAADGTTAYVATSTGILVVDIASHAVTKTINVGSGATSIVISADGTVLFALTSNGFLSLIDIAPGSSSFHQVTKTINVGSGATSVAISADGALLYVTKKDENAAIGFRITSGTSGGEGSSTAPGAALTITQIDSVAVGEAPGAIAMFPNGSGAIVVNRGSGSFSFLGAATTTAVEPQPPAVTELELVVYPTPSAGAATLRYAVPERAPVTLELFDIQGRLVQRLVDGVVPAGRHTASWKGIDRTGSRVGAGIYLVRMRVNDRELLKRIVWLR